MRLFLGISLPQYFLGTFEEYQNAHPIEGVRWIPPENLHITVYFVGEVEDKRMPFLVEKLQPVFQGIKPFNLAFEEISFAPPNKQSRMVWAVFSSHSEYSKMVEEVSKAVREFMGQQTDRKEPIPHVTLARFRDPGYVQGIQLGQPKMQTIEFPVSSCQLMESRLTPTGAQYTVLHSYEIT